MYTKQLRLEQISKIQYADMTMFWRKETILRSGTAYVRIHAPIIRDGHEFLLNMLKDHPFADEISVNNHGRWEHAYVRRVTDTRLKEMAGIAARDGKKRNYLEVKFKRGEGRLPRATIGFRVYDGNIIGYELEVPRCLEDLFDIQIEDGNHRHVKGLWVPKSYKPGDVVGGNGR